MQTQLKETCKLILSEEQLAEIFNITEEDGDFVCYLDTGWKHMCK